MAEDKGKKVSHHLPFSCFKKWRIQNGKQMGFLAQLCSSAGGPCNHPVPLGAGVDASGLLFERESANLYYDWELDGGLAIAAVRVCHRLWRVASPLAHIINFNPNGCLSSRGCPMLGLTNFI
jgi:hypothetical protein